MKNIAVHKQYWVLIQVIERRAMNVTSITHIGRVPIKFLKLPELNTLILLSKQPTKHQKHPSVSFFQAHGLWFTVKQWTSRSSEQTSVGQGGQMDVVVVWELLIEEAKGALDRY